MLTSASLCLNCIFYIGFVPFLFKFSPFALNIQLTQLKIENISCDTEKKAKWCRNDDICNSFFAPVPRSIFSRIFFSFQFQFAVTSGAVQTGIQIIIYREKAET